MNNVFPTEINIIFEIYSSSANRRDDTGLHTQQFLVLEIVNLSCLAIQGVPLTEENRVGNI